MSDYRYCKDKDSYFEDRLNHNDRLNCNDRLNHEEKENCFERPERCCQATTCNPFKPNCKSNCCSGLPKVTPDLSSVFSVPILADKIFDCMKSENPFFGMFEDLEFTITSQPPQNGSYTAGTDVCVDRVSFSYDAIGAIVTGDNTLDGNITICSELATATAINPTTLDNDIIIANDFSITTGNIPCCHSCHHHNNKNGTNCRVLERELNFYISDLVITVTGRAGCIPFTAESAPQSGTLNEILGLPSEFNFFGKICLPHLSSGIPLRENFKECLSIECIEPTTPLQGTTTFTFNATVESSLLIIKSLYALIQENLSVLAIDTPREHCCNNSGLMKPHK